jgi:hypothetical protein
MTEFPMVLKNIISMLERQGAARTTRDAYTSGTVSTVDKP